MVSHAHTMPYYTTFRNSVLKLPFIPKPGTHVTHLCMAGIHRMIISRSKDVHSTSISAILAHIFKSLP